MYTNGYDAYCLLKRQLAGSVVDSTVNLLDLHEYHEGRRGKRRSDGGFGGGTGSSRSLTILITFPSFFLISKEAWDADSKTPERRSLLTPHPRPQSAVLLAMPPGALGKQSTGFHKQSIARA